MKSARVNPIFLLLTSALQYLFLAQLCAHYCAVAHPQCLDFRAPFKPYRGLFYCKNYRSFTCCTKDQDIELYWKYYDIQSQVHYHNSKKCALFLRRILCLQCDPYAAHIFDSENRPDNPLKFPGLCPQFCEQFYKDCRHLISYLTNDSRLLESKTSQSFCGKLELTDSDYCYPNLLINENIYGQLKKSQTSADNCICVQKVAENLRNPVFVTFSKYNKNLMYVLEQIGIVWVYRKELTDQGQWMKVSRPFLNITDRVMVTPRLADERGLLGLAFHPLFDTNRRLYIYYTGQNKKGYTEIRISQLKALTDVEGDRESEVVLMAMQKPNNYWNHNGGMLLFGADGFLYIFTGDGGGSGDKLNLAQNKSTLFGKALRIDVTVEAHVNHKYGIPYSNPFTLQSSARPEIYAYGLRNSWRCAVDRGEYGTETNRGRILCGDVGQDAYEEINVIEKGANYGWRAKEGYACFDEDMCATIESDKLPIQAYSHRIGKSITAGYVYRGCTNANLNGKYLYADYMNGKLFTLSESRWSGRWTNASLPLCADDLCTNGLSNFYYKHILSFAEDFQGEIYMLSTSEPSVSSRQGTIYKIIDPRRREDPSNCKHSRPV